MLLFFYMKHTYVHLWCTNMNSFCFVHLFGQIWGRYEPVCTTLSRKYIWSKKKVLFDCFNWFVRQSSYMRCVLNGVCVFGNKCLKFSNKDNCFAVQLDIFLIKSLKYNEPQLNWVWIQHFDTHIILLARRVCCSVSIEGQ